MTFCHTPHQSLVIPKHFFIPKPLCLILPFSGKPYLLISWACSHWHELHHLLSLSILSSPLSLRKKLLSQGTFPTNLNPNSFIFLSLLFLSPVTTIIFRPSLFKNLSSTLSSSPNYSLSFLSSPNFIT